MRKTSALLVCALFVLLLSPAIGLVAGSKPGTDGKPDKPPGKPESSPPETATFRISIGAEVGEDVVLTDPDGFDVITTDEGWYPPVRSKLQWDSWRIPLGEGRYGTYTMGDVWSVENETYLTDFYDGEDAQLFGIEHYWDRHIDYWQIGITWTSDLNGDGELDPLMLVGCTDRGPEPEGSYIAEFDRWTITFTASNAYFGVGWCDDAGCWLYWCGYLQFTVTIQKNPYS